MTTTSVTKRDFGRQPDYHIGPNGLPRLTTGSRMRKMNSHQTDPVKLNKCLYNLTVRNGTGSGTNNTTSSVRSDKIESDIAIRNQSSSKSSSSNGNSSSLAPGLNNLRRNSPTNRNEQQQQQQSNNSSSIPRISTSSSISSSVSSNSSRNGIMTAGSRTLLSGRRHHHRSGDGNGDGADANLIGGSSSNGDRRSVLMRQYRLSAAIDNRLSYQRKYDRTIFGCNRPDQFVLPPLQI